MWQKTNKQLSSSHRSAWRTLGDNTLSKYISQQHEYLMFDGQEKETQCRYKLCTVSSVLKTTTEKEKLKLTLIYLRIVSVIEFNEIFGEQPPRQLFLPEVLLVKKQHSVCNACILWVIYGLFTNLNTANTCVFFFYQRICEYGSHDDFSKIKIIIIF